MKLSMWTLHSWLSEKGFNPAAEIHDGGVLVCGIHLGGNDAESGEDYAILTALDAHAEREGHGLMLACGYDRIFLPGDNRMEVHDALANAFEYYNTWEKSFLLGLLDGNNLHDLLDMAHSVFQRPMFIKSSGSWVFAITQGYDAGVHPDWARLGDSMLNRKADLDSVKAVSLDPDFQDIFARTYPIIKKSPFYGGDVLHANVWMEERRICEIVALENGKAFNPGDTHLMRHFSCVVERHIRQNKTHFLTYSGLADLFVEMIEKDEGDFKSLDTIRQTLNWLQEDELAVFCIQAHAEHETPIVNVLRDKLIEEFPHGCVFLYKNLIAGVANITRAGGHGKVIESIGGIVPEETFIWSLSYEFIDMKSFVPFYRQAEQILAYAITQKAAFVSMHQIALSRITDIIRSNQDLQTCVHPDVRRLQVLDTKNSSNFIQTLFEYLMCGGNYTDAAHRLNLHRNSLIYRMSRIQEVVKSDLNNSNVRKEFLFSCLIIQKK